MSWSFLIWSSLAMSANSSRKPSRLLHRGNKSTSVKQVGLGGAGKRQSPHTGGYSLEPLRGQEVQQVEELLQVVLKRSAGQQQLVLQRVVVQHAKELARGR